MKTDWNINQALLVGEAMREPEFSHASHGEDFYRFPLRSLRLSGTEDLLNVLVSRTLLEQCPVRSGERIQVEGEVRSYNNRTGVGNRLVITFFARSLSYDLTGQDENRVRLGGCLCKPPVFRVTPLGREITDLILAVNRPYGRGDYLPCIAWGSLAARCGQMEVGDKLLLTGRLQSREYTKLLEGAELRRTAYEISIMAMEEQRKAVFDPSDAVP